MTKVLKPKPKQTIDIGVNTKDRFSLTKKTESRYSSGNSSLNTPSSGALYSNNISKNTPSRHSNDLERQYLLKKKYNDSLNNYPHTRLTPGSYDSQDRPNSTTGSIKLRKSVDSSQSSIKNNRLDMYSHKKYNTSKNSLRRSENNAIFTQNSSRKRKSSSKRKHHQNSNKIFVNRHLMNHDPGAAERGQGFLAQNNTTDSDMSFDVEVKDINKGQRSNTSINSGEKPRPNRYSRISMIATNQAKNRINPIRIKNNRNLNNRSNSSSKIKKKKSKSSSISISKINNSFTNNNATLTKTPSTTKSRKGNIEMKLKTSLNDQMTTLQHQINMMNLGHKIKTPQFKIPTEKFQLKRQYFNAEGGHIRGDKSSGKRSRKSNERKDNKEKINHSRIYDQVSRLS